jgi:Cu+-exporting ATPase
MTQKLDLIFGKPGDTAIDPVCKMTVDPANPPGGSAEHDGQTYYFCGPGCRGAFVKEPASFLSSDEAHMGHMEHDHEALAGHDHDEHAGHEHGVHATAEAVATAICYPCRHNVDKATAPNWEYKGTTFYFCSTACAEKVKAEPERWLVIASSNIQLGASDHHDHGDEHAHDHHGH